MRQLVPVVAVLTVMLLAGCGAGYTEAAGRDANESRCRGALAAVRGAMAGFYAEQVLNGPEARYPTRKELTTRGLVFSGAWPENPYNGDGRVAGATREDAEARTVVGTGEGWAYYDGSDGGSAVFYCNTRTAGIDENTW